MLFQVNLFLKDMSLSLLCEHKKCFISGITFQMHRSVYFDIISELNALLYYHMCCTYNALLLSITCEISCYSGMYYISHSHMGYVLHMVLTFVSPFT
jgi:hypothetical protein